MLKKTSKILITFLAFLIILFPIVSFAVDTNIKADVNATANANEENGIMLISEEPNEEILRDAENTKNGDLYLLDKDVTIDYTVNGNVFVMANSVTINSQIIGDVFIMADTITIDKDAYLYNNLFALANNLTVKGVVYDIYTCSNTFVLSDGFIHRDLHASCDNLDISGIVQRNAYLSCNSLTFGNHKENQETENVIHGNLEYSAKQNFSIPEGAVEGETKFNPVEINDSISIGDYLFSLTNFLCFAILIWLLLLWIAPKFLQNVKDLLKSKKSSVILYGILGLIVLPIISFVLLVSSVASSAGLLVLATYILLLCIAKSIFTIAVNSWVCEKWKIEKTIARFGTLLVSGIIVWGVSLIPYIGSILSFLMVIIGLGVGLTYIIPTKKTEAEK